MKWSSQELEKGTPSSPRCDKCQTDLTVDQIIQDCTKYSDIQTNVSIPLNMEEALNENNISKIIKFLTKINLIKNF